MPILRKSNINTDTLMRWAERKLGPSKCKQIKIVDRQTTDYGWYDWSGIIYINIRHFRSMTSVYRVLAHEWTHAQQKYFMYARLYKKFGYREHPYEKAARKRERTCFNECLQLCS
jgi:hypothetical protein